MCGDGVIPSQAKDRSRLGWFLRTSGTYGPLVCPLAFRTSGELISSGGGGGGFVLVCLALFVLLLMVYLHVLSHRQLQASNHPWSWSSRRLGVSCLIQVLETKLWGGGAAGRKQNPFTAPNCCFKSPGLRPELWEPQETGPHFCTQGPQESRVFSRLRSIQSQPGCGGKTGLCYF